ncbi:MAG: tetratricopeptide repeat protein [Treponema sp.]|nr:tetratricopeptide repeat protein [Treponema sp.]
MDYTTSKTGTYKKKINLRKNLIIALCVVIAFLALCVSLFNFILKKINAEDSMYTLKRNWKAYDYSSVYETSEAILRKNPFNNAALTYKGYSAFYLGVSQNDTSLQQEYLDSAINALRLSLLTAKKSLVPQVSYMLGKSYFYKNTGSSYYYCDLAIKYLRAAKDKGYVAEDIHEYLGLCYASLGMTMDSIASFSEALLVRESDTLLLSIAEQYTKQEQYSVAKQYLFRVINESEDDVLILKSCLLLGSIYIDEEQYEDARTMLNTVLEKDENNADAYYQFGLLYQKQGDAVRARSSLRRALRLQPNHQDALKKISEIRSKG